VAPGAIRASFWAALALRRWAIREVVWNIFRY